MSLPDGARWRSVLLGAHDTPKLPLVVYFISGARSVYNGIRAHDTAAVHQLQAEERGASAVEGFHVQGDLERFICCCVDTFFLFGRHSIPLSTMYSLSS